MNMHVQVVVLNGSKVIHVGNIWQYDHHFFGTKFVRAISRLAVIFYKNFIEELMVIPHARDPSG